MSRFMITGGAGFIGSHIAEFLTEQDHNVVIFDNFSTGNIKNLDAIADRVRIVEGDICDIEAVKSAISGVDYVVHHAAEISMAKSVEDPVFANRVNVEGTLNILMAAKEAGAKRFVLASSSAVYGDTGKTAQREDFVPNPMSPYGASKIAAEHYCSVFHQIYGLETVRLRYFNVYGPRQNPKSQYAAVIPKFIDRIIQGQDLRIYGDGEQTRDFVFVRDIARANYLACTIDTAAGQVFNIGTEISVSVNDLATKLVELSGKDVKILHDAPLTGDIKYSSSCISKARELLRFDPSVTFSEGVKRTLDYFTSKTGTA